MKASQTASVEISLSLKVAQLVSLQEQAFLLLTFMLSAVHLQSVV